MHASTSYDQLPQRNCSKLKQLVLYGAIIVLFLLIALGLAVVYTGKTRISRREADGSWQRDGQFVAIQEYPPLAAVLSTKPYLFLCTAVILNERYLVASANCFTVLLPNLMVRTGSSFSSEEGNLYKVEKFFVHGEYDSRSFNNNLAVIKTKYDMVFDNVTQAANISEAASELEEKDAVVVGWGNFHKQLMKVELKNCRRKTCIPSSSFCDRGLSGAVIANQELAALWSLGNIHQNRAMELTPITPYKQWIQTKIHN